MRKWGKEARWHWRSTFSIGAATCQSRSKEASLWQWRSKIAMAQQNCNGAANYAANQQVFGIGAGKLQWRSKIAMAQQTSKHVAMAQQTSKLTLKTELQFVFSSGFPDKRRIWAIKVPVDGYSQWRELTWKKWTWFCILMLISNLGFGTPAVSNTVKSETWGCILHFLQS